MKTQIYLLPIVVVSSALVVAVTGFQSQLVLPSSSIQQPTATTTRRHTTTTTTTTTTFLEARSNKKKVVEERPSNEFSRTVSPDKVLKMSGKHLMRSGANRMPERQYAFEIDASEEECQGLAQRFDLPAIASLGAALSLTPEGSTAVDSQSRGILVKGTVQAHITRTCVRTNERFPVDMEFPIYALVRPVPQSGSGGPSPATILDALAADDSKGVELNRDTANNKHSNNNNNKKDLDQSASYGEEEEDEDEIDPDELLKMQTMLEGLEDKDEDVDDILMEDEYIYATTGALDVGELVSQLFWLELDPYPRKPGSEFKAFSITG